MFQTDKDIFLKQEVFATCGLFIQDLSWIPLEIVFHYLAIETFLGSTANFAL